MRDAHQLNKQSFVDAEFKLVNEEIRKATLAKSDIFYLPILISESTLETLAKDFHISYAARIHDGRIFETSKAKASLICLKLK